jgi:galactonate dehydratase
LSDGNLAERAHMPFWLQMVGTGLTATFAAHLGAVLKEARWPAIPCVNIYSHVLVQEFAVEGGHLRVPEAPGLGIELDREAVERLRVEPDFAKAPVRQIHAVRWPDGRVLWAADGSYRSDFTAGKQTGFSPGMQLAVRLDDGSEEFDREYRERFPERA